MADSCEKCGEAEIAKELSVTFGEIKDHIVKLCARCYDNLLKSDGFWELLKLSGHKPPVASSVREDLPVAPPFKPDFSSENIRPMKGRDIK